MVTFEQVNLIDDIYPSLVNNTTAQDIIVCRNVLMYFRPEIALRILDRLSHCLVDGGWLVVSAAESPLLQAPLLERFDHPSGTLYRKIDRTQQRSCSRTDGGSAGTSTGAASAGLKGQRAQQRCQPGNRAAQETADHAETGRPAHSDMQARAATAAKPHASTRPEGSRSSVPDPDAYQQAQGLYQRGEYEAAADILERLLDSAAKNRSAASADPAATELLVRVYANQGDLCRAEDCCRKAIAQEKLDATLHYLLAVVLQEKGDLTAAKKALQGAVFLDHDFALAHFAWGNLARQQGRQDEARRCFEHARSLLSRISSSEVVPHSEGLTVGRLAEMIQTMM
jgi:chemotaxis protein methyltransferase CheR